MKDDVKEFLESQKMRCQAKMIEKFQDNDGVKYYLWLCEYFVLVLQIVECGNCQTQYTNVDHWEKIVRGF